MSRLAHFRDELGFNLTTHMPFTRQYSIKCDSCEALVINGTPCHETGCPNMTHECGGIDWVGFCPSKGRVRRGDRLCESCIADAEAEEEAEAERMCGEYD